MVHTASPLGQLPLVIPAYVDTPDVRADLALLIGLIEPFTNMRYTTRVIRDNAISAAGVTLVDGMVSVIQSVGEVDLRVGGVWKKIFPLTYSGTGVPSNAVGVPGDIFLKYA